MSGAKKQPTISMFFASSNNGGPKKYTTDEGARGKNHTQVAEVKETLAAFCDAYNT